MNGVLGRLARAPLLHFAVLGAALLGVQRALPVAPEPIVVGAAEVRALRAEWTREMRRPPTAEQLQALLRRHGDEEILVREALRLGLERSDPVVRRRLAQNMRFVGSTAARDAARVEEALALDMHRRDLLVRRRLAQAMRERLAAGVTVDEAAVRDYVAAHPDRYASPERISFRHVFLDADRRGELLDVAAAQLRAGIHAGGVRMGDPFLAGHQFVDQSEAEVAGVFGREFARAAFGLAPGQWSQPIRSPYGLHLVRLSARRAPGEPDYEAVRSAARYALLAERERAAVEQALRPLRARHPLAVESEDVAPGSP